MNKIVNTITSKSRRDNTLLTVDGAKRNLRTKQPHNPSSRQGCNPILRLSMLHSMSSRFFLSFGMRNLC